MTGDRRVSWRTRGAHGLLGYVVVGLVISVMQNVAGLLTGNLSAFVWVPAAAPNLRHAIDADGLLLVYAFDHVWTRGAVAGGIAA